MRKENGGANEWVGCAVSPLVTMEHIIIRHHMSIDDYLIRERYIMMGYHVTIDRH